MPFSHYFKPAHKDVKRYYEELAGYAAHEVVHEGAVRSAFSNLLAGTAKKADWHLVPEQPTRVRGKQVRPDGTLRDDFNLHRGYWEAKDTTDKLDVEIRKKIASGYPLSNTIFEDTASANSRVTVIIEPCLRNLPRVEVVTSTCIFDILRVATKKAAFWDVIQQNVAPATWMK